jgi:hypothetical protein
MVGFFSADHLIPLGVNIMFHVLILLTFLTVFFFEVISKITTQHINTELKSLVSQQTWNMMMAVDQKEGQYIDWKMLQVLCATLKIKYSRTLQSVLDNNQTLYDNVICFLGMFGVVLMLIVAYCVGRNFRLGLAGMLVENVVIFLFVGMIEIYFFLNIASKYIPVRPDDAVIAVVDQIKERLQN